MLPSTGAVLLLRAEPDLRILSFGIAVSVATALLFGLVPALQATKLDLSATLKASSGGISGTSRSASLLTPFLCVNSVASGPSVDQDRTLPSEVR